MSPRLFILEDDEIVVSAVKNESEKNKWTFQASRMCAGTLEAMHAFSPDIVLLDVNLPDGEGYEICRQMRAEKFLEKIPVIFLTSNGDIDCRLKGFEAGAQDYIVKPFIMQELAARIRAHSLIKERQDVLQRELSEICLNERIQAGEKAGPLGGHRRLVTVMFNDIRGFTQLSETEPAEIVAALIKDYYAAMMEELVSQDGTFDKFIGDALMAFWNDPIEQSDHAERAVRCAVRMQRRTFKLNEEFKKTGRPMLRIGIGINTGEAVVGNQGSRLHSAYTALGDHVNIAARLMSKAEALEIVISAATVAAIPDFARLHPGGRQELFELKGRTEPVEAVVLTVREDF